MGHLWVPFFHSQRVGPPPIEKRRDSPPVGRVSPVDDEKAFRLKPLPRDHVSDMCGRFTLRLNTKVVADHFDADARGLEHPSRFNIAPEDDRSVLMVGWARDEGRRALAEARWGLIPHWVDDPDDWPTLINARSETAPDKPAFRDAFRERRCLIPADGFYEWLKVDGGKQPFFIHRKDDAPFAFAGLWDHWRGKRGSINSCTILTCSPNEVVAKIHDRMPVVLPEEHYEHWLRPETWSGDPQKLLVPYPDPEEEFEAYPVSKRVNDPSYDTSDLVEPISEGTS